MIYTARQEINPKGSRERLIIAATELLWQLGRFGKVCFDPKDPPGA